MREALRRLPHEGTRALPCERSARVGCWEPFAEPFAERFAPSVGAILPALRARGDNKPIRERSPKILLASGAAAGADAEGAAASAVLGLAVAAAAVVGAGAAAGSAADSSEKLRTIIVSEPSGGDAGGVGWNLSTLV